MVCFSEGSIWGFVKALPTHWHLWSAPIGRYRPGILPLTGMMSLRSGCMVRTICGQLVTSCLHLGRFFLLLQHPPPHPPLPSSLPPTPSLHWTKIDAHLRKNRLKRPEIKQGATSKVNYILFNRLLNPVLLNKSGLVRAKVSNFNLKSLNRCFSNYYQVRIMHIFVEPVTINVHKHQNQGHGPHSTFIMYFGFLTFYHLANLTTFRMLPVKKTLVNKIKPSVYNANIRSYVFILVIYFTYS